MTTQSIDASIDLAYLVQPTTTRVQDALAQTSTDSAWVMTEEDGYPIGLLTVEQWHNLANRAGILADLQEDWLTPVLIPTQTPLTTILSGLDFDQNLPWHVVMNKDLVMGVVSPTSLVQAIAQLLQQPDKPDNVPEEVWGRLKIVMTKGAGTLAGGTLPGNVLLQEVKICYHCPGDGSPHAVSEAEAVYSAVTGRPFCPLHRQTELIPMNPSGAR